jgi:predicted dinucleotide-utilizing enzyme
MTTSPRQPSAARKSPSVSSASTPLAPLTARVPAEVLEALNKLAVQQGVPVSVLQRQALEDLVQAHLQTKPTRRVSLEDLDKKLDVLVAAAGQEAVQRRKLEAILAHLATALGLKK